MKWICQIAFSLAAMLPLAARAEKANVFFIHGANVSEQDGRAWAAEMFKRLWQAGANMEFHPISWESDNGPSYNYQVNVSNAFVTASRLAPYVNSIPGRRVIIAHSLGTMVAAAAIQDYGMQVEKLIMLNSAIPSEAFDPSLADVMMVKGYEDVLPATHALYGDAISNLAPNQRRLFKDAGLVCHHLIRSYEEVDEERREYLKLRESIREKTENGESMDDELLITELFS